MNIREKLEALERDTGSRVSALTTQVAGNHYKGLAIQPVEYITRNNLGYLEGNVVKYVTRHGSKGGADDVRKAIHYCELLLEMKYSEAKPTVWICSCSHPDLAVPIGQACPICKP